MSRAASFIAVIFSLCTFAPPAYAAPDELEIHLDEINKPGEFGFDGIFTYTPSGARIRPDPALRSTHHLFQFSPDFSYGLTRDVQLDVQLFSSIGLDGRGRLDGGRLELLTLPVRPEDDDDDGLFFGGLFEVGHLPRTLSNNRLDAEFKMFLGYRVGRWTIATNPEIGLKVSGDGSSAAELSTKFKLSYRLDVYSVGLEQYSDLGRLSHVGSLRQQSQQTFAVVDFKGKGKDFQLGVGRGWNDFSERWVIKGILSFPF